MHSIIRLFVISLLSVVFFSSISAQQRDQILFGTYLPSSDHPKITYHKYNDTNLVKIGFNTIFQTVMHPKIHADSIVASITTGRNIWKDNRTPLALSTFNNIVAMNGMWVRNDPTEEQTD